MNISKLLMATTIMVGGLSVLVPQTVLAYKGDVTVQGPNYTAERHAAMTEAFAKKDYTAWKLLMDGKGVTRKITATNFERFAEAHQLALQGKTAEASKIRAELGLGQKDGSGFGQGQQRNCQK